jgi:hypothetical protein
MMSINESLTRDFRLAFFMNQLPQAPEYFIGTISNIAVLQKPKQEDYSSVLYTTTFRLCSAFIYVVPCFFTNS